MSLIKLLTIFIVCLVAINCDVRWGRCEPVQREMKSFDLNRYLGTWKELAHSKSIPFQSGECTQADYSLNDDGTVRVYNTEVINGHLKGVVGRAEPTENPFQLKVSFSDTFWGKLFKGDYQVVDTDYESYVVVYSCTNLVLAKNEFVWILSRTGEVSAERFEQLTSYVEKKLSISKDTLHITDRSEEACKYED
jgi:apolipoprotein D and lipocalin family protein